MKKLFIIIGLITTLSLLGYQHKDALAQEANKILYSSKCDTPIPYRVGSIDPKFNLTQDELSSDIQEAGDIWGTTIGKKLFTYDPQAKFVIDLIYDERQQLSNQINELDTELKGKGQNLKPEISDYQRRVAEYKNKMYQLNDEINKWNSQGGAPEDVYNKLVEQQSALKKEAEKLNAQATSLNQSTEAYNTQAEELQQRVGVYNQTLTFKPEEGVYMSNENGEKIIVYFYNSKQEMVHTLAHEMGHALGLDHSANTEAIMFSRTNNVVTPSADDIAALTEVCRKRSIVEVAQEKLPIFIYQLKLGLNNVINKTTGPAQTN